MTLTAPLPWPPEHDLPPITGDDVTDLLYEAADWADNSDMPTLTGPYVPRATVRRHLVINRIICHAPLAQIDAIIAAAARHTSALWWLRNTDTTIVTAIMTDATQSHQA